MSDRPNILYIMTDQHRADWLGCAGHPVVKTPNIDSIAACGTRFTQFYVTTPVCMPNRGAVFTGRYPSVNGLRHNGLPLPKNANTFVDVLRAAGYHTATIGKSHLQPFGNVPVIRSDEEHVANEALPEAKKPDGADYANEHPSNYETSEYHEFPQPYYGFDHVRMVTNHSDECGGHYLQWLRRQTNDWEAYRDRKNQLPHEYTNPQAIRTRIPEELYPTSYIGAEAQSYLRERAKSEKPFFAFVSFPDPHHPFTPPGKYWDMYDPDDFAVDLPFEAHKNPPDQLVEWKRLMDAGIVPNNQQQAFMAPKRQLQEAMALTAGMITMIDDQIGEILKALEENGQSDNTIIIFNADHGDYMGAFDLLLKGPFAHDSVNRVPFIWADPKGPEVKAAEGLAASVDIAATLLERVGLTPYYGMQGRSFLQQLSGGPAARDVVLIEHEENKVYPGFEKRPNMRHVITDEHRMTVYKSLDFGELYDRLNDPDETHNLWDIPEAAETKADMLFTLNQAMMDAIESGPWPKRLA
ncbi:sulfatase-like hydrolase/transferase [Sulfitobacter sp. AS92]|uniref:sulfatase family protein n=1 Tax=Sulfitobacter sp. AS92 TaxID=3135783 RepID=UPI0031804507